MSELVSSLPFSILISDYTISFFRPSWFVKESKIKAFRMRIYRGTCMSWYWIWLGLRTWGSEGMEGVELGHRKDVGWFGPSCDTYLESWSGAVAIWICPWALTLSVGKRSNMIVAKFRALRYTSLGGEREWIPIVLGLQNSDFPVVQGLLEGCHTSRSENAVWGCEEEGIW